MWTGRILPNDVQLVEPIKSGAISFVAASNPTEVAITNQKADVMQKPLAVK
jgi:hypothetical protein